ncbi:katanin p60 ATPase-containing subunit A-like 2 isoform X2 [Lampetra fluviatilis]
MEMSYQAIKTANQVREADELRTEARRKNLLVLILHYLTDSGYMSTASALEQETNTSLRRYEVCDNVDLETIMMEYESYYYVKFQKYPKITKKLGENTENCRFPLKSGGKLRRAVSNASQPLPRIGMSQRPPSQYGAKKAAQVKDGARQEATEQPTPAEADFGLNVAPIGRTMGGSAPPHRRGQIIDFRSMIGDAIRAASGDITTSSTGCSPDPTDRLLKPLGAFAGMTGEMRELASIISRDIYLQNPNVRWDDIIGLDAAKRLVKEAVVYPIKYPQLFTGILSPWKGLLLYGPPGTGKTMLAKAVATECKTTFFNISASSIVSKWRGDSEKLVKVLFELARYHAPSTIFLDELESVMGQRGAGGAGELDHAMLRRLEKRILVDLPSAAARRAMILHHLPPVNSGTGLEIRTELDYEQLAQATEGYSGSDILLVCKEAAMRPVRKIFDALESHRPEEALPALCLDTLHTGDLLDVLAHTKPSARTLCARYTEWQREYESV